MQKWTCRNPKLPPCGTCSHVFCMYSCMIFIDFFHFRRSEVEKNHRPKDNLHQFWALNIPCRVSEPDSLYALFIYPCFLLSLYIYLLLFFFRRFVFILRRHRKSSTKISLPNSQQPLSPTTKPIAENVWRIT